MRGNGLIVAILLILGLSVSSDAVADTVVPTERVTSGVNVREGPGNDAPAIGMLRPGESATYLGESPHKFHVRLSNGIEGYVSKSWTRLVAIAPSVDQQDALRLTFIDVGQGDSTLVECPNGKNILVDAGSLSGAQEEEVRDYLLSRLDLHQRSINTLIVTHPDRDHYSLLPGLMINIPIDRMHRVGEVEDYTLEAFRDWLVEIEPETAITVLTSEDFDAPDAPSQSIDCGSAKVWILAAGIEATKSRTNAMSIVLLVQLGDFKALLTGDATFDTEKAILERYPADWLDIDLLKIGHHGSLATSTSKRWVDVLKPEYAVVSSAAQNTFGHPRKEVIERVAVATIDAEPHRMLYATGTQGDYDFIDIDDYREAIYATGVEGNIVVSITGNGAVSVTSFPFEE